MRHRLPAALLIAATGITVLFAAGRPAATAPEPGDEAAIRREVAAYVKAFNAGDAEGMLAVWAADGEYVDPAGVSTRGSDNLGALFARCLHDNPRARVEITTRAVRVLKQGVALHDGTSVMTRPDGESETIPFSAVWVKADGRWAVQLVHNLAAPAPGPEARTPAVADLGWLVGEWSADECGATLTARWMDGEKFLAIDYTVCGTDGRAVSVAHVIGIDPTTGWLKSWAFETARGGCGAGFWQRDRDTWTVGLAGATGDGHSAEATHVWSVVDADTFTLRAVNREVAGTELPDLLLTFRRSGGRD